MAKLKSWYLKQQWQQNRICNGESSLISVRADLLLRSRPEVWSTQCSCHAKGENEVNCMDACVCFLSIQTFQHCILGLHEEPVFLMLANKPCCLSSSSRHCIIMEKNMYINNSHSFLAPLCIVHYTIFQDYFFYLCFISWIFYRPNWMFCFY